MTLRLRQICLVAPELEPAVAGLRDVLGIEISHRDGAVGKYGLVNAVLPIGQCFLGVGAPTREGTAAGRSPERRGGAGARLHASVVLAGIDLETTCGRTVRDGGRARAGRFEDVVGTEAMDPGAAGVRVRRTGADGLGHAHEAGIVHRDVKPANVLVHADGRPLLADFGPARTGAGANQLTMAGITIGTPGYIAPEPVLGKTVDLRADIYAYAAMIFRALTGRLPYTGDSVMEIAIATVREPIPSATAIRHELPDELDQFMLRALAKEPSERPATMADLVAMLNKVPQYRSM
mgnify:CR=1 FL=1